MRTNDDPNHTHHSSTTESTGPLTIRAARGLHARVARRLAHVARSFQCSATLHDRRGHQADARNLLELLLLGVRHGEPVTLRCLGADADAAFVAIAAVLSQEAVSP